MTAMLWIMLALIACTGCSGSREEASSPRRATLRLVEVADQSEGWFHEGAVWHTEVKQTSPMPIVAYMAETASTGPLTVSLYPKQYEITSYTRACDGNCGQVGKPEGHCKGTVHLTMKETTATVHVNPGHACWIEARSS
jgi:hypothetical protein